jgi:anti-sigma factor RsiW
MCDCSEKLIAWLDRELPEDEANELERHVQHCIKCQSRLDAYKEVDQALEAYCDRTMTLTVRRKLPRWVPVLSGAAATIALLLIFPRGGQVEPVPSHTFAASAPVVLRTPPPSTSKRIHKRSAAVPAQSTDSNLMPPAPTVQIALPAAAMFPPGAVPEGVSLTAEFSVAADGSAQRLHLRP